MEVPKSLKAPGKAAWVRLTSYDHIAEEDYFIIKAVCDIIDKVAWLEREVKNKDNGVQGELIGINHKEGQPTNWILHPFVKRIDDLNKRQDDLLKELGLTPKQRVNLQLAVEIKKDDATVLIENVNVFRSQNNE